MDQSSNTDILPVSCFNTTASRFTGPKHHPNFKRRTVYLSRFHWVSGSRRPTVSLLDFALPNHQVDEDGDDADGDEREEHHQPVRRVLQHQLLIGAVVEVLGVDEEEEVLSVLVWIKAVDIVGQPLQTPRELAVRTETGNRKQETGVHETTSHRVKHHHRFVSLWTTGCWVFDQYIWPPAGGPSRLVYAQSSIQK